MLTQTTSLIAIHALTLTRSQAHFQIHTHTHTAYEQLLERERSPSFILDARTKIQDP